MRPHITSERDTRRERVDPRLQEAGWLVVPHAAGTTTASGSAIREYPTANGPADYALWLDGRVAAVVEAKKLTIGPQGVLTQAGPSWLFIPAACGKLRGVQRGRKGRHCSQKDQCPPV